MNTLFFNYLQAGIFGSVIILLTCLLRLILTKAPRRIICLLWLLAAVRLLLPFQIESSFSLQPRLHQPTASVQQTNVQQAAVEQDFSQHTEDAVDSRPDVTPTVQMTSDRQTDILSVIWICGMGIGMLYMIISYCWLRYQVRQATFCGNGIWENERLKTAFVLGYQKPKIYIPYHLDSPNRDYIIAHEQAHIARGDNWWKLLGFLCVCLHWYSPIVWLGYFLLCRDIEVACDERVISHLNIQERKAYSYALLSCGKQVYRIVICPVAFGEISLKQRIKNVLSYKKPAFWITLVSILVIITVCICFMTTPNNSAKQADNIPPSSNDALHQSKPETEPATEFTGTVTEPSVEQTTEPPVEQTTEPPVEQTTEPPIEQTTEPPTTQPPTQPPTEPSEDTEEPDNSNEISRADQAMAIADSAITSYAASLGFQVLDSYPNTNVKTFSSSIDPYFFEKQGEQYFIKIGKSYVDAAYQHCLDTNADVENSIVWVNVFFVYAGARYRVDVYCAAAYQ